MIHPLTFLKGAGLGAGMMYFFDPASGNRRRALVRDQIVHACTVCEQQSGVAYRDASNRLQGAKAEISKAMQTSDQPIVERVQEGVMGVGRTLSMQGQSWSPAAKAAAMIGGASLVASLLSKRDIAALAFGIVGLSLAAKEMAGQDQMRSGQQRSQGGDQQRSSQPESESTKTAQGQSGNTSHDHKRQDTSSQSKESNEGAGMEASVPTEKKPIHNL